MRGLFFASSVAIVGAITAAVLGQRRHRRLGESEIDPYESTPNPMAPARDEPAHEGGCLRLGRKHTRYGDPYRVCLTENQERVLFKGKRDAQKKLGCGVFACAYTVPGKTRVVKFTRDVEDVAGLIAAQKTDAVPKVYAVYKLAQGGRTIPMFDPITFRKESARDVPVYAVVLERLRGISDDEQEIVNDEIVGIDMDRESACEYGCSDLQNDVLALVDKLATIGIKWNDIHAGNIGYDKHGKLKVLDLGLTRTQLRRRVKVLKGIAGARRRVRAAHAI